jgi:hypothetical protein
MPFINGWRQTPIPGLSLGDGGILALANLNTIAQRTAITGGASWFDSLVLAPGLHYQQAADELARGSGRPALDALETEENGRVQTHQINNAATIRYLQKVAQPGRVVTLDVGDIPSRFRSRKRLSSRQHAAVLGAEEVPDLGWLSHLLYVASPCLTLLAIVLEILLEDWWGIAQIGALMLARVLNIIVIKRRCRSRPRDLPHDPAQAHPRQRLQNRLTDYMVHLGDGKGRVMLHGMSDDLQAITSQAWMGAKTSIDGYLEAAAKLLVYLTAALSGNVEQAGAIIVMVLLLVSAGLLGLSNENAKSFQMHGRVAHPQSPGPVDGGGDGGDVRDGMHHGPFPQGSPPYPHGHAHDDARAGQRQSTMSWPNSSSISGPEPLDDWAEKGQVGAPLRDSYPFDESVNYS